MSSGKWNWTDPGASEKLLLPTLTLVCETAKTQVQWQSKAISAFQKPRSLCNGHSTTARTPQGWKPRVLAKARDCSSSLRFLLAANAQAKAAQQGFHLVAWGLIIYLLFRSVKCSYQSNETDIKKWLWDELKSQEDSDWHSTVRVRDLQNTVMLSLSCRARRRHQPDFVSNHLSNQPLIARSRIARCMLSLHPGTASALLGIKCLPAARHCSLGAAETSSSNNNNFLSVFVEVKAYMWQSVIGNVEVWASSFDRWMSRLSHSMWYVPWKEKDLKWHYFTHFFGWEPCLIEGSLSRGSCVMICVMGKKRREACFLRFTLWEAISEANMWLECTLKSLHQFLASWMGRTAIRFSQSCSSLGLTKRCFTS